MTCELVGYENQTSLDHIIHLSFESVSLKKFKLVVRAVSPIGCYLLPFFVSAK